jgi:hypothetical protein
MSAQATAAALSRAAIDQYYAVFVTTEALRSESFNGRIIGNAIVVRDEKQR